MLSPSYLYDLYNKDLNTILSHSGSLRKKFRGSKKLLSTFDPDKVSLYQADITRDILICSDIHFYHKNIISYTNRPFTDVEDMNCQILDNINQTVSQYSNPYLINVGDFSFCGKEKTQDLIDAINCEMLTVMGNHDIRRGKIFNTTDEKIPFLQVEQQDETSPHLLFTHFPLQEENIPEGYINVHGHTHDSPQISNKHINVCVEHTLYRPIHLNQIFSTAKELFNNG